MSTREAVICEPLRTPVGRYGGMFESLTAVDLGVTALRGLLDRTGTDPAAVDDVVLGHCYPVPVAVATRQGEELIHTDEHPCADTSVESLAGLEPVLPKSDPEATITAGNASGQNDAASMCIGTTAEKAAELRLIPLVRLVSWGSAGVAPNVMGIGPVPATAVALGKTGLVLADIDLIELNEATAAQALAVMREWKFGAADRDRTNVHGSGISLGHPVGATGSPMLGTLARELNRRGARYGLEARRAVGGQGLAAVFERVGG